MTLLSLIQSLLAFLNGAAMLVQRSFVSALLCFAAGILFFMAAINFDNAKYLKQK